jgi:hypothetical protein
METNVSSTVTMMPTDLHSPVKTVANGRGATKCQEEVKEFSWEITSINVHLGELRQCQAKVLGITEPQWTILMALTNLDKEHGVSVKVALDEFLFGEFDHPEFTEFMRRLTALRKRLELARMKVALDF